MIAYNGVGSLRLAGLTRSKQPDRNKLVIASDNDYITDVRGEGLRNEFCFVDFGEARRWR